MVDATRIQDTSCGTDLNALSTPSRGPAVLAVVFLARFLRPPEEDSKKLAKRRGNPRSWGGSVAVPGSRTDPAATERA